MFVRVSILSETFERERESILCATFERERVSILCATFERECICNIRENMQKLGKPYIERSIEKHFF